MGRRLALAGGAIGLLFLLLVITGIGPSLPGPQVRSMLGLSEEGRVVAPCTTIVRRTRSPVQPVSTAGAWRREPPSPLSRVELKGVAIGRRVFLVGGQGEGGRSLPTVRTFDPASRRYGRAPNLPSPIDHPLVVTHRGDLYVAGGYISSEPTDEFWRYAPRTRRWTRLRSLPSRRGGLGGAVIGDRLYAVGGAPRTFPETHAEPYATLDVYDFERDRWTSGPPMPSARHHLAAAALGGKLYVVGGREPRDFSTAFVERFDPRGGVWERLAPLPLGVGGLELVAARGELIAIGGDEEEGWEQGRGWVTAAVWAFNPERGTWRRLPDLGVARHGHAAAIVGNRVYVFEGSPCAGFGRSRAAESLRVR